MKFERLGNITTITSGGTPLTSKREYYDNGTIPWVKTGDLKVKHLSEIPDSITQLGLENSSAKIFPVNTVLVAMYGATIGACSILKKQAATNQACAAILPNENLIADYLFFYLSSIKQELISKGIGGGQPNISATILKNTKILVPPLELQIHIANILTKAENLIQQRKQSIALLDAFLKSTFSEMFIEKGFPYQKLGDLSNKITDGEHQKPVYRDSGMPFISVTNITNGFLDFNNCKYVSEEDFNKFTRRCKPELGDIVYTKVGATYGRAVIVDTENPFCLYVSVALIKPKSDLIISKFLQYAINHPFVKRQADKSIKGAGVPDLHLIEIKSFKIPVPPIELQNQFAHIVTKTETLKQQYQESLQQLEQLFGSLSQQAFKGELVKNYDVFQEESLLIAAEQVVEYK